MRQAAAVFACFLEFICTEQVSDQNTGTAAHTADQAGEETLCNRGNRVCCNGIASHVTHDDRVQHVGNSPDERSRQNRESVAPEIFREYFAGRREEALPENPHVVWFLSFKVSPDQLNHTGSYRCIRRAADAECRSAEETVDQDSI